MKKNRTKTPRIFVRKQITQEVLCKVGECEQEVPYLVYFDRNGITQEVYLP